MGKDYTIRNKESWKPQVKEENEIVDRRWEKKTIIRDSQDIDLTNPNNYHKKEEIEEADESEDEEDLSDDVDSIFSLKGKGLSRFMSFPTAVLLALLLNNMLHMTPIIVPDWVIAGAMVWSVIRMATD